MYEIQLSAISVVIITLHDGTGVYWISIILVTGTLSTVTTEVEVETVKEQSVAGTYWVLVGGTTGGHEPVGVLTITLVKVVGSLSEPTDVIVVVIVVDEQSVASVVIVLI